MLTEYAPHDARLLYLPSNRKGAASDYRSVAVPRGDFVPIGNYGIVLDGMYLLVDFDRDDPRREEWVQQLPPTWTQTTPHGEHRLFRVPPNWQGKNVKIVSAHGEPIGDVKVHGYFVGPGSSYEVCPNHPTGCDRKQNDYRIIDRRDPVDAPGWVLELCERALSEAPLAAPVADRERMLDGERDNELTQFAGFMRRLGYGERAIATGLSGIVTSGLVEQPTGREVTAHDVARIARSVASYPTNATLSSMQSAALVSGADIPLVGPPVRWWVRGFVPRAELSMVYGDGGSGKSTWASWLCAQVTNAGGKFVFCGVEEPFRRFLMRAVLMGADRSRVYSYQHASRIALPASVKKIREDIALLAGDGNVMLYFDSIYSHFQTEQGLNAAERARRCLAPLAEWAQEDGVTVIGVFHTNKAGEFLGSVEMRNVARYVLRATRKSGRPMRLDVDKTNIWDPGVALTFEATEVTAQDPLTGDIQQEEQEDGSMGPMLIRVVNPGDRIVISPETALGEIDVEQIGVKDDDESDLPIL